MARAYGTYHASSGNKFNGSLVFRLKKKKAARAHPVRVKGLLRLTLHPSHSHDQYIRGNDADWRITTHETAFFSLSCSSSTHVYKTGEKNSTRRNAAW